MTTNEIIKILSSATWKLTSGEEKEAVQGAMVVLRKHIILKRKYDRLLEITAKNYITLKKVRSKNASGRDY